MSMGANGPTWAYRGLRPWTVLVWLPLCYSLLIAPIAQASDGHSLRAWLIAAGAAALFTAAVLTRFRRGPNHQRLALLALVALAALAVTATVAVSSDWSSSFVLLAIGVGVVVGAREAPYVLLLLTAVATGISLSVDGSDSAFTTGLTVLMSGFGTYAFHQLFAVVTELRCTREELARVAVSQERERFARDLHDLLGHTLSVMVVKAEAVRRLASRDSAAAAAHAFDIETIGREALADVRRAASGYRGAGLERELGRARSALEAAGVTLSVEQPPAEDDELAESVDVLLGWVVREAVTNVVRHAQATHCTITVERDDERARIDIVDNGGGPEAVNISGSGLRGLRERVAAAGGRFEAGHTGGGFRLVVEVPSPDGGVPRFNDEVGRASSSAVTSPAAEVTAP